MFKLPIFGWFFSTVAAVSMAIPFWICWTVCGIGERFFYWLPAVYRSIPFWSMVGLFIVLNIIGSLIGYLSPRLVSVNNSTEVGAQKK